jgi:hypothetical protein
VRDVRHYATAVDHQRIVTLARHQRGGGGSDPRG